MNLPNNKKGTSINNLMIVLGGKNCFSPSKINKNVNISLPPFP